MKNINGMPWDEVEAELIEALPNDDVSDLWRYSDVLPRGERQAPVDQAPASRRAG